MDPDTTLADMIAALQRRDWDVVEEAAESLLEWLAKRGFPPLTLGPKALGKEWHHTLSCFTCHVALTKVRDAHKRQRRKP